MVPFNEVNEYKSDHEEHKGQQEVKNAKNSGCWSEYVLGKKWVNFIMGIVGTAPFFVIYNRDNKNY